jgi:hypothetical protein
VQEVGRADVGAGIGDDVVTVAAMDEVDAVAALDGVVTLVAPDRVVALSGHDQVGLGRAAHDHVVAAVVDEDIIVTVAV